MPPLLRHPSTAVVAALAYTLYWSLVPLVGDGIGLGPGTYWMLYPETVLKATLLVALFVQTAEVQAAIRDGRIRCARAGMVWATALVAIVVVLAILRDPMALHYNSATSHLTSHKFVGFDFPPLAAQQDRERHEAWLAAWGSGAILASEVALALGIGWVFAFLGVALGRWKYLATLSGWMVAMFLCGIVAFGLEHIVWTYDIFHEGIASGSVFMELAFPLPVRVPESVVAAACLLAFALGSRWLLRSAEAWRVLELRGSALREGDRSGMRNDLPASWREREA